MNVNQGRSRKWYPIVFYAQELLHFDWPEVDCRSCSSPTETSHGEPRRSRCHDEILRQRRATSVHPHCPVLILKEEQSSASPTVGRHALQLRPASGQRISTQTSGGYSGTSVDDRWTGNGRAPEETPRLKLEKRREQRTASRTSTKIGLTHDGAKTSDCTRISLYL